MNNYSVESSTKDTLEFLEELLSKAIYCLNTKEAEQRDLFQAAKDHAVELTQDDDQLFALSGEIIYDCSNYTNWEVLSWFGKLLTHQPVDDRKTWYNAKVAEHVAAMRLIINNTFDTLETMEDFYNNLSSIIVQNEYAGYGSRYQPGYELTFNIISSQLPDDMPVRYNDLAAFSNNIDTITKMYESFTVHDFVTVSIEERMLKTIDLVQKYMVK